MAIFNETSDIKVFSKSTRTSNIISELLEKSFNVKKLNYLSGSQLNDSTIILIDAAGLSKRDVKKIIGSGVFSIIVNNNDEYNLFPSNLNYCTILENLNYSNLCDEVKKVYKKNSMFINFPEFIGTSNKIEELKKNIFKIKDTDQPLLILGESGTGKELVTSVVNKYSKHFNKSITKINCSGFNENNMDALIFGTEKGFFTDVKRNLGLVEQTKNGVLFLDEITTLDYGLQAKVLRVIEEKKIRPIGSTEELDYNARFIAASNENILELVSRKKFRKDLYFRLGALKIVVPPLRERKEDIPLLAKHFLKVLGSNCYFSDSALDKLMSFDWPGNVRQLKNIVKKCSFFDKNLKKNKISADKILYYY